MGIDDVEIHERPPVSRGEMNGVWTQVDATRIAVQSQGDDISDIKRAVGMIGTDMRWLKAGVFLLLAWNIIESVMESAPAQALVAMVSP